MKVSWMTPCIAVSLSLVLLSIPSVTAAQEHRARQATDLITHSTVAIDRPASVVWPYIVEPSRWKQGLSLRHHAGQPGAVGEVLAAFDPADPETIVFLVKNAELVPNERRTIKLYLPGSEETLLGFATWTLTERGGRTRVTYDVYTETLLPREEARGMTAQRLAEMEREGYELNQPRFDRELVALKELVEGQR